ncbi:hypothetical protein [Salsuginibacillus kocurii]|uniref:hypothetical protein n=1 Tax=Salsuginibacillus kocurii TaxID=427078 RepID=UPI00035C8B25|nr:hypothetical protein [Salsuginibacillus kocurii]
MPQWVKIMLFTTVFFPVVIVGAHLIFRFFIGEPIDGAYFISLWLGLVFAGLLVGGFISMVKRSHAKYE